MNPYSNRSNLVLIRDLIYEKAKRNNVFLNLVESRRIEKKSGRFLTQGKEQKQCPFDYNQCAARA